VLANLFLHYAFDVWMKRTFPQLPWCRYADDGLVHCRSEQEAQAVKQALQARFEQCGLELHPTKTQIVYCKDGSRKGKYPNTKFDFLGYTFRPRLVKNRKRNSMFVSFTPAVSATAIKTMRQTVRKMNYRNRTELSMADISRLHNPVLSSTLYKISANNRRLEPIESNPPLKLTLHDGHEVMSNNRNCPMGSRVQSLNQTTEAWTRADNDHVCRKGGAICKVLTAVIPGA